MRTRACGRIKPGPFGKNSEIYYPNDLCSPSRVLPVPGPGGAFGSDACIRVSAGHDVTAADVAFAVVRRVIKLACAVSESRVRAPVGCSTLGARVQLTAGQLSVSYLDDLAPDSVRAASDSA